MGDTEVTGGIRQGCTGSPQLFVMVVNMVINSIVEGGLGNRDEKFYVPVLFYADDGLLLAGSSGEAEGNDPSGGGGLGWVWTKNK